MVYLIIIFYFNLRVGIGMLGLSSLVVFMVIFMARIFVHTPLGLFWKN